MWLLDISRNSICALAKWWHAKCLKAGFFLCSFWPLSSAWFVTQLQRQEKEPLALKDICSYLSCKISMLKCSILSNIPTMHPGNACVHGWLCSRKGLESCPGFVSLMRPRRGCGVFPMILREDTSSKLLFTVKVFDIAPSFELS